MQLGPSKYDVSQGVGGRSEKKALISVGGAWNVVLTEEPILSDKFSS